MGPNGLKLTQLQMCEIQEETDFCIDYWRKLFASVSTCSHDGAAQTRPVLPLVWFRETGRISTPPAATKTPPTRCTLAQVRHCRIIDVLGVCQPLHLAGSSHELTAITATMLRLLHSWAESSWRAVSARCWLMVYFQTFWRLARTNACENRHKTHH